ncbi:hypothetical protein IW261DRAFT_1671756 [Armillaria novae-zelandiae]|uniref:Uncharacterized protein n=1 Tax=Armillaria novae-zelandiae TaxID=153914 RepID=A0AA39NSE3_9AGAR|nr:hypothetical protein IW261DRAFT_1671756 [Armillaria novae-zelandiae]
MSGVVYVCRENAQASTAVWNLRLRKLKKRICLARLERNETSNGLNITTGREERREPEPARCDRDPEIVSIRASKGIQASLFLDTPILYLSSTLRETAYTSTTTLHLGHLPPTPPALPAFDSSRSPDSEPSAFVSVPPSHDPLTMTPFSPVDAQLSTSRTFFKQTTRAYERNKREVLDELLHSQDDLLFCDKQPILNLDLDGWTPVPHMECTDPVMDRDSLLRHRSKGKAGSERAGIDVAATCDRFDFKSVKEWCTSNIPRHSMFHSSFPHDSVDKKFAFY